MIIWPGDATQSSHWRDDISSERVFRIAILSTPRTGNTWLRRLLDGVYCMPQVVADSPAEVEWERLPPRCILQLHWDRDEPLLKKLSQYAFRKITICRHPLDVLVSILHFASVHTETGLWMGGRGGGEEAIKNVLPSSAAFLNYAMGPRADLLFSISCQWASDPDCLVARYEDFVQEPVRELTALCSRLQPAPDEAVCHAVAANTLEKMRKSNVNQHFWQGKAGNWVQLVPAQPALEIAAHHRDVFEALGYSRDLDVAACVEFGQQADINWYETEFAVLKEECRLARSQAMRLEQRLSDEDLEAMRSKLDGLMSHVAELQAELQAIRADRWGPSSVARKLHNFARRLWPAAIRR